MTSSTTSQSLPKVDAGNYEICINEQVDSAMLAWFEGFSIQSTIPGKTTLTGRITDQSALHGLLARIRDLNLTLISVNRIEPEEKES